jgi:serine/threonine kinase 16
MSCHSHCACLTLSDLVALVAPRSCSSMPYRAPELFDVHVPSVVTEATDVWSLGCTLYALAFGFSPFEVEYSSKGDVRVVDCSHLRVIAKIPFPPRHHYTSALVDLIRLLLQQDPAARPTVSEVCRSLLSRFEIRLQTYTERGV